jgi:hypothetical protein
MSSNEAEEAVFAFFITSSLGYNNGIQLAKLGWPLSRHSFEHFTRGILISLQQNM